MAAHGLRTRFLLAGCLLVATTVACGVWSAFTFAQLSAGAGQTLRESQETIAQTAALATALEREDDALLLSLAGDVGRAKPELQTQRRRFDQTFARLTFLAEDGEERQTIADLQRNADAYRIAGDALLASLGKPGGRERYHRQVNPALRRAVADCGRLREFSFRSMQQAAVGARDEARRATGIVALISLAALALSTLVAVRLTQGVIGPVRALTESVEAVRQGDFDRRVPVRSADELGRLAEGFNRMAQTLAAYRDSNLGELLQAKTTLEAALAALPNAVLVLDPEGRIVSANPLALEILRATGRTGAGRLEELPLTAEGLQAAREALAGRKVRGSRKDGGGVLPVSIDGRPVKLALAVAPIPEFLPKRRGAVVVLDDVTEFVRLDELRGELVAVASHELKTPLTTLRMSLLLLEEQTENLSGRQRELLAAAALGAEELAATIDELLDLTRIEAGQLRLPREPVDVYAVIDQAARSLQARFQDAEIALRIVRDVPAARVRGDAARLKSVFANLLTNALKYTPRGGDVTIRVAGGKPWLEISVTDTGRGIPSEFRERVFEKFFRVEHQMDGPTEGTRGAGIGLYLCRQIVEAHGGIIRCEAGEAGRGTRVVFQLPPLTAYPVAVP